MNEIIVKTKKEWRNWLKKNHKKEKKVALISYKKHTRIPSISHRESMEEAICFGWIDTTIKRIDENRFARTFAKRNENSKWSTATLSYAKKLLEEKRMSKEGIKRYEEGLKKIPFDTLIPKNPDMPEELKKELTKNKALALFEKFAPSTKRMYLRWLVHAKLPETQKKRIGIIVQNTLKNNKRIY